MFTFQMELIQFTFILTCEYIFFQIILFENNMSLIIWTYENENIDEHVGIGL